jgi:predicted protein tyrosine phosphatase
MCLTRTPVSTRSAPTKRKEFGCVCNSIQIFAKTTVNIEQKQPNVMVSHTIETLFSEHQAEHVHQSRQRRRHADKITQIGVEWHRIETILTKFRQQRVSIKFFLFAKRKHLLCGESFLDRRLPNRRSEWMLRIVGAVERQSPIVV